MQVGVPTAIPCPAVIDPSASPEARAMPKSASNARPLAASSSTFSGLTSR